MKNIFIDVESFYVFVLNFEHCGARKYFNLVLSLTMIIMRNRNCANVHSLIVGLSYALSPVRKCAISDVTKTQ